MPAGSPEKRKLAFVIMPFDSAYDDVYRHGIKDVLEEQGYWCLRADEEAHSGQIVDEIHRNILESDLIVAEMSEKNANVYYEVGYAHGAGKEPILITRQASALPFDLRGYKHIEYQGDLETLRRELRKYIEWVGQVSAAMQEIVPDPRQLRDTSKAILLHLYEAGEDRPAAECAVKAKGIFASLKDLRFLGYVRFYGPLLPNTAIHLTEIGKEAARKLLEASEG